MNLRSIFSYNSTGQNVYNIVKNLTLFIEKFVNKNLNIQNLLNELSQTLEIPKSVLEKRTNQILYRSYEFQKKKFNLKKSLISIFYDFLISLGVILLLLINTVIYKKKKLQRFDLVCDNICSETDLKRHELLSKNFDTTLLLGYKNLKLYYSNTKFINVRNEFFNFIAIDLSLKQRLNLFYLLLKSLLISLFKGFNLILIFKILVYDYIKYKKIYSQYSAKYYFNYKFYDTNPLQNYLFKKAGGEKTSCFQKNICTLSISCFIYVDIFFSLGKDQGKICNDLGGQIDSFQPVGSLFMEHGWFKQKKDLIKIPDVDILIIGINAPWPTGCINDDFHESYYNKFILWLKKLSEDFPTKKIYYKHHSYFKGDSKEKDILAKSNIKVIVDDNSINSTYGWAFKSKIIFSFASTMIVELLGNEKQAFFIDPGGINFQWFYGIKNLENYKIKTYNDLKRICLDENPKKNNFINENKSFHCLPSHNTSEIISNFLKNKK